MEDLRKQREIESQKKLIKRQRFFVFMFKHKYKFLIGAFALIILFFPEASGQFIGQFITDFLGNIIKYIKL